MARKLPVLQRVVGEDALCAAIYGTISSSLYFALGRIARNAPVQRDGLRFGPGRGIGPVGQLFVRVPLAPGEPVAAGVIRDCEDPRRELRARLERPQAAVGLEEGLLRSVARLFLIAQGAVRQVVDRAIVPLDQCAESLGASGECGSNQGLIVDVVDRVNRRCLQ